MVTLDEIYSEDSKNITFKEAIAKIKKIADENTRFKIGKTGQELSERFSGEYDSEYNTIKPICKSDKSSIVDDWEKNLIIHFKNEPGYKDKCDNKADGGGDMTNENSTYIVYVVSRSNK